MMIILLQLLLIMMITILLVIASGYCGNVCELNWFQYGWNYLPDIETRHKKASTKTIAFAGVMIRLHALSHTPHTHPQPQTHTHGGPEVDTPISFLKSEFSKKSDITTCVLSIFSILKEALRNHMTVSSSSDYSIFFLCFPFLLFYADHSSDFFPVNHCQVISSRVGRNDPDAVPASCSIRARLH